MKRSFFITLLLIAIASAAACQDLLIRYDIVNKNINYFKVRKRGDAEKLIPMKNPRVPANRNVRVEYVNMNPFVWNQPKVNLVSVAQDSISSFNPFTMMLPSNLSDRFSAIGFSFTRDAAALTSQQQLCARALRSLYEAYDEIDLLKYDFKLTKQEILDQSGAKIHDVLKTCKLADGKDTARSKVKRSDFESLKQYFNDICQMDFPANRSADNSKTDSFLGIAGIDAGSQLLQPAEALYTIEKNYTTVSNADFTSENSFIIADKDMVLHMDFTLTDEYVKKTGKDSASVNKNGKQPQKVRDQSIFIPVTGGVRVSSSAGIGFTYLGSARKNYYVEDSVIASSIDNRIVPIVGTFLNVYSRGMGAVNLGGSFGIFASLEEKLAINYLLGFTTVIGRKERILITAGCVMAPVEEPSKGLKVGDTYTNPDFPTKLNYKPGIFFCIHYNVGKF